MSKNIFNSIKLTRPRNNVFDLSHDVKLSLDMGKLIPTLCMEAVPGDKFHISSESLLRFAPLVSPVMHRMDVTMHYFFVPNRILWPNWEKFITNTKVGTPAALPAFPFIFIDDTNYTGLCDYLGIPTPVSGVDKETISALPFAAYQKIYDDYYRDQNLVPSEWQELVDGDNSSTPSFLELKRRAWEHDYFTASLPFAQKGDVVDIPLGGFPDVEVKMTSGGTAGFNTLEGTPTDANIAVEPSATFPTLVDGLYADTSSMDMESTTINDLRRAFRLQEWLEKNARGGTRYIENILSHFGVRSSDKRLQRPEYITGVKAPVVISEVLNTSNTAEAPQGNMAGHAISVTNGHHGAYFCEEHGYIIGIMSVMPKTAYQQGIPRHFLKTVDPTQYFWPSFANIGEQEVQNREIYAYQGDGPGSETFGYVPRYAEYKYQPSRVAGDFRSTLDFWHLGRIFATPPSLNREFIECDPDPRVFAVTTDDDHLYAHVFHRIKAVRPMPKFGTPSF